MILAVQIVGTAAILLVLYVAWRTAGVPRTGQDVINCVVTHVICVVGIVFLWMAPLWRR